MSPRQHRMLNLLLPAVLRTNHKNSIMKDLIKVITKACVKASRKCKKKTAGLLRDLQTMLAEGQQILEGMFREQEPEIKKLVCTIVADVIQAKIEEDDEIVVRYY